MNISSDSVSPGFASGYLAQTHTSSGRIPTDRGYRFFVDNFVNTRDQNAIKKELATNSITEQSEGSLDKLLEQTVIMLSTLTQHTAVVVRDSKRKALVIDVHISRIDQLRFIVALFFDDSTIEKVVVKGSDLKHSIRDDDLLVDADLDTLVELFRTDFIGKTLQELIHARSELESRALVHLKESFSDLQASSNNETSVHVAGVANITKSVETNGSQYFEISTQLMALFEQHMELVELVKSNVSKKIDAKIGKENRLEELSLHSMVLAPFTSRGGLSGALGVIGPTRMDYLKVFTCLNSASSRVSKYLDQE